MSWSSALPAALAALAWVLLPGLAATTVAGLRGVAAWAAAPLVSIGVVAGTAVAAEMVGLPWSPPVALGGAALLVAVAAAVRFLRRGSGVAGSDGPGPPLAALAGAAGAVCLTVVTAVRAIPTPGTLSQTYDAVFHYNAVAAIVASGRGSSLTVGELTDPAADGAFYPAAWHDLVALVVQTTGAAVPLATNVVALVVAGVVWPLSCLLLVREIAGPRVAACLAAPLVAVGFIAFPWSLMSFGVLWPNLIGLALVPAALAAVVAVCGLARDGALGTAHAVQLLVVGAVAIGFGHPGAAFSLAVLSVAPLLWWLGARLRALVSAGRVALTAVTAAVPVALAVGATAVVTSPLFDGVRSFDWPAYQLPSQAAGEVLLNATNGKDAAWALSAAVVVGAFAATRERTWRWLLPAHLTSAMLFILASSLETPLAATLTGLWYNDSFRLAAMVPVTGVPLAVLGLLAIGGWAARTVPGGSGDPSSRPLVLRSGALTIAATAVLVALSSGLYVREHAEFVAPPYSAQAEYGVLPPARRAFLERVGPMLPADTVVAQNPWSGSALLPALTGREVLFPHLDGNWTPDQLLVAERLDEAGTDPRVCEAAARLGVGYVLVAPVQFWIWDDRTRLYPGIDSVTPGPGFELVEQDPTSGFALHRLTGCARGGTAGTSG